jgi:superfamily I DNA/RNA helicase
MVTDAGTVSGTGNATGALSPNAEQRPAVEAAKGPLIIVAGPGTGKTKTLTAHVTYLVQKAHVPAQDILALTFTNKAAGEMQERITAQLGKLPKNQRPVTATFHALANLLLDLPESTKLAGDIERVAVLQLLTKSKAGKGMSLRNMSQAISTAKNQLHGRLEPVVKALVDTYNLELHNRGFHDYDDLLVWLHEALGRADFRAKAQRFTHILVDEFQDTNELQYDIVRRLNRTGNLFVIGDPLQSIYSFRGASSHIFDLFAQDFPKAKHIELTTNYRSAPQIVRLAGALFPDAPKLHAHRRDPGRAAVVEVLNGFGEADWVVNEIQSQVGGSDMLKSSQHAGNDRGRTFADFAVMSRTHAGSATVQAALEKSGIPYQVVGEGSPFLQPHATAILQSFAYLAGFGEAPSVPNATPAQVARLLDPLKKLIHEVSLSQLASQISQLLDLAGEKNQATVKQFTNSLVRYDHMHPGAYVQHVEAMAEQEYYDPAAGAVTLLTIHASKGLEFPVVFVVGVEEGSIPLARKGIVTDPEEEKRLFYVAVTRARDELYLLHARTRKNQARQESPFTTELPKGAVERLTDPAISGQLKRIKRRAQKRAQGNLFS